MSADGYVDCPASRSGDGYEVVGLAAKPGSRGGQRRPDGTRRRLSRPEDLCRPTSWWTRPAGATVADLAGRELGSQVPPEESVMARAACRLTPPGSTSGRSATPRADSHAMVNSLSPTYPCRHSARPDSGRGGRAWMLTLIGLGDDTPPIHVEGFDELAACPRRVGLPSSDRQRPAGRPPGRGRSASRPAPGDVTTGSSGSRMATSCSASALCAFNPVYAQGMTVAAVEATILRDCLREVALTACRGASIAGRPGSSTSRGTWRPAATSPAPTTVGRRTRKVRVEVSEQLHRQGPAGRRDGRARVHGNSTRRSTSPCPPTPAIAPAMIRRVLFGRAESEGSAPRGTECV